MPTVRILQNPSEVRQDALYRVRGDQMVDYGRLLGLD